MIIKTIVFISLLSVVLSVDIPRTFKICKRNNDNETFTTCMFEAVKTVVPLLEKGVPELEVAPCQPLKLPPFTVGQGKGIVKVTQNYRDVNIFNLVYLKLQRLRASMKNNAVTVNAETLVDHLQLKARYDMNGSLLLLPVYGDGNVAVDLYDVDLTIHLHAIPFDKRGVKYLRVKDLYIGIGPKRITYNFENLFNGNKLLGDNINKVLNENPLEVYLDVQRGYEEEISKAVKAIANSIIIKIPFDKLFPA